MGLKEGAVRGGVRNVSTGISVIPDSAVNQWPVDEGSGSTLNDAVGSVDLSTTGGITWTPDNEAEGGFKVTLDGADDEATGTKDIDNVPEILFCATIETTSSSAGGVICWGEDSTLSIVQLTYNFDGNGKIQTRVGDGSTSGNFKATSTTSVNDGQKYRVQAWLREGAEIGIAVNGVEEDTTSFSTKGNPSSIIHLGNDTFGRWFEGAVDNPILYTDSSQQTQEIDYNLQPWS